MDSAERYKKVCDDIVQTALAAGRDPAEITLIAVSKGHSWGHIQPVYDLGCRQLGESRTQEALPKMEEAPSDIQWHLIGSLQKNKVRKAVGHFILIHSVDSLELAEKISSCSLEKGIKTSILLEVNTSGETSKHGMTVACCRELFDTVCALPGIKVEGLMTLAPLTEDVGLVRSCFATLRHLREELTTRYPLKHLSMGMSHDYRLAIAEGATLLRIGRLIFGD